MDRKIEDTYEGHELERDRAQRIASLLAEGICSYLKLQGLTGQRTAKLGKKDIDDSCNHLKQRHLGDMNDERS